jgi:hypothetical protein
MERFKHHARTQRMFNPSGLAPLAVALTGKEACAIERKWIKFFGKDNLCNKSMGQRTISRKVSSVVAISFRVMRSELLQLKREAGPHGSVSSVIRLLLCQALKKKL